MCFNALLLFGEDRCLHAAFPIPAFLEMLTRSVTMRTVTATHAGCVQRGMGHNMPLSGHSSRDDPPPNILQLNTEGLTANKISIIEQVAYKNKTFIIVLHTLQETQCATAESAVQTNWQRQADCEIFQHKTNPDMQILNTIQS